MARRVPLSLRAYAPGDVWRFEPRADFMAEREASARHYEEGALGHAWTVMRGDQIVGVAGALDCGGGTWSVACLLVDLPRRAWPQALGLAGSALAMLHREHAAAEIMASHRADNPAAGRTLQRLGFTRGTWADVMAGARTHHTLVKVL